LICVNYVVAFSEVRNSHPHWRKISNLDDSPDHQMDEVQSVPPGGEHLDTLKLSIESFDTKLFFIWNILQCSNTSLQSLHSSVENAI
jgi:hypothetical protein